MNTVIMIEYILVVIAAFYLVGLAAVWICEMKRNALYGNMLKQLKILENFHLNAALNHIKTYKITEDYRLSSASMERMQQFILKNMLFAGKRRQQREI